MEQKRKEMKEEFLALTPLERIRQMNAIFNNVISLKAKTQGVPEYVSRQNENVRFSAK
jgi:hypothetical protein